MLGLEKNARCLICGETLFYADDAVGMQCMFCGDAFYTNRICENEHYVCDECHGERALEMIMSGCLSAKSDDALGIAYELLMNKWVRMHGSEHHFLVAAALLTAYHNRNYSTSTANWDFEGVLAEAKSRAMKICDNACGFWGCCGAAIGAGIFASLALKAMPVSVGERGTANLITSKALEKISVYGGPRCCKRETFTAIFSTSQFTNEYWDMPLTDYQGVECQFHHRNIECIGVRCPFNPEAISETEPPVSL